MSHRSRAPGVRSPLPPGWPPFATAGRGRLVAGHGGCPVVQNHQDKADILNHGIDQGRNPGMKKRGIAQGGHDVRPLGLIPESLIKARGLADGSSHADKRVHRAQIQAQRIAADVTGIDAPGRSFLDGEKAGPVRTSRTKRRASARAAAGNGP